MDPKSTDKKSGNECENFFKEIENKIKEIFEDKLNIDIGKLLNAKDNTFLKNLEELEIFKGCKFMTKIFKTFKNIFDGKKLNRIKENISSVLTRIVEDKNFDQFIVYFLFYLYIELIVEKIIDYPNQERRN